MYVACYFLASVLLDSDSVYGQKKVTRCAQIGVKFDGIFSAGCVGEEADNYTTLHSLRLQWKHRHEAQVDHIHP